MPFRSACRGKSNGSRANPLDGCGSPIQPRSALIADWLRRYLRKSGQSALAHQHLATVVRLHRENHYDRTTHHDEQVPGQPADRRAMHGLTPELFA